MIQIIDDDLVTCQIIAAMLERMRYPYCEAHTGAEAMQQLRTQPIDMVIADMMLPDAHGLDLLAEKHSMPHLCDIPVLCCTAQADIDTVEAAVGYGAVDFVKKPITVHSFPGRITRAMERAPLRWESWREMSELNGMIARGRGAAVNIGADTDRAADRQVVEGRGGARRDRVHARGARNRIRVVGAGYPDARVAAGGRCVRATDGLAYRITGDRRAAEARSYIVVCPLLHFLRSPTRRAPG